MADPDVFLDRLIAPAPDVEQVADYDAVMARCGRVLARITARRHQALAAGETSVAIQLGALRTELSQRRVAVRPGDREGLDRLSVLCGDALAAVQDTEPGDE